MALVVAGLYGRVQASVVLRARDLLGEGAASAAAAKESVSEVVASFARMFVMPSMLVAFVYLTMTAMAGAGSTWPEVPPPVTTAYAPLIARCGRR